LARHLPRAQENFQHGQLNSSGLHAAAGMQAASGCLLTDSAGNVLLVKPTYKPPWEVPGGVVEEAESPLAACRREVREELSLDIRPTRLLVVDYLEPQPGRRGDALRFIFDGGELTSSQVASIKLDEHELSEFRFVHPGELASYVILVLARRMQACLTGGQRRLPRRGSPSPRLSSARRTPAEALRRRCRSLKPLTPFSQTGELGPDAGGFTGHPIDPDLHERTPVDSPDVRHGSTSEGWGFESLRARQVKAQATAL
jgi:8-oxo-dGTP diphosphatase